LRSALELGQFELRYQPKIDLFSGVVTGCEALLRWHHPERGMVLPARFIGIAEESRLIVPIGAWVLRRACTQLRSWMDLGYKPVPVAVNLSVQQFTASLPDDVAAVLAETGLDPALLEIEITETVMMTDSDAHMDIARRLKALGVRIALDDFGTGYSSLSYLRRMDVDVLKIDQSFVRELPESAEDSNIIAAITAMAGQFHIKVVAEGVESQAQVDALKLMNCAEYQGFLFSEAVPQAEFEQRFLVAA
jgi:EAL domain-containing protein (putative c-di-GMP-specific phosphodiesterase class I)